MAEFKDLLGKTVVEIKVNKENDNILFVTEDEQYLMYHEQSCCENVYIESIVGDLNDLVGNPILLAEEVTNDQEGHNRDVNDYHDSYTWTFYKLATIKGYVDIRWLGTSNGYYSESVDFIDTTHWSWDSELRYFDV